MKNVFFIFIRLICGFIVLSTLSWTLITCSQDLQTITLSPLNPVLGPNGMATAVNPGSTMVTATYGLITGITTLTVGPSPNLLLLSVTAPVYPSGTTLTPVIPTGLNQQFTATATYQDSTTQDITSLVSWSSNNPGVATINAISGLATGVGAGTANITAAYGTFTSAPVPLTVVSASPPGITITAPLNPASVSAPIIPLGLNQQFTATGAYSGTNYNITNSVTWSSNNTFVAIINSATGLATATGFGTTSISATTTNGPTTSSIPLTVINAAINSISVTAPGIPVSVLNPVYLLKGLTQQLAATGTFADGNNYDITPYVTWGSQAPLQIFVNSTGLATASGVFPNSSLITAAYNGISGSATGSITLAISPATLEAITIFPAISANPVISNGLSQKFTATGLFSDGSRPDISTMVGWTLPQALLPIATISNGYYQQMVATGTYNGGSGNISSMVTWTSNDLTVAFVNPYGMVSAIGPGTTTINAAYQGITTGTTVTVFTPVLNFIRITPQNPVISISSIFSPTGTTLQFTATGYYSDGTSRDVTGNVIWTTAQPNTAVFNSITIGLVTAVAPGTTTISATAGSIIANTILVVN